MPTQDEQNRPVDLNNLVENALALIESRAYGRINLQAQTQVGVLGSENAITHMMLNLLINALQHSPERSVIDVEVTCTEDEAQLLIRNEMLGSINDPERIFDA